MRAGASRQSFASDAAMVRPCRCDEISPAPYPSAFNLMRMAATLAHSPDRAKSKARSTTGLFGVVPELSMKLCAAYFFFFWGSSVSILRLGAAALGFGG